MTKTLCHQHKEKMGKRESMSKATLRLKERGDNSINKNFKGDQGYACHHPFDKRNFKSQVSKKESEIRLVDLIKGFR